jgi:hypothetical protein
VVRTSRCGRDNPGTTPGEGAAREALVGVAHRNWGRPEVGIPTWRKLAARFPNVPTIRERPAWALGDIAFRRTADVIDIWLLGLVV